jgi:hypothetical protein
MHPMGVGPHVGARNFTVMPMSRTAFGRFSHPVFPHHAFFSHRFFRHRFAFVGGPSTLATMIAGAGHGPQCINLCTDYSYGY